MAGNYSFKIISLLILSITIVGATDTSHLDVEADYVAREIKNGKAIPEDTLRSIVGRSKGTEKVFNSFEDLQNSMKGFLETDDLDPKYQHAAKPFLQLAKTLYDEILEAHKADKKVAATEADPLGALVWEVAARLMPSLED
ncbi:MAG: hypothetical protein K2W94_01040 [Alphaproteobacteria bacterium]|nr:hypothetical protein [Alphaproteobacteria bacterium]